MKKRRNVWTIQTLRIVMWSNNSPCANTTSTAKSVARLALAVNKQQRAIASSWPKGHKPAPPCNFVGLLLATKNRDRGIVFNFEVGVNLLHVAGLVLLFIRWSTVYLSMILLRVLFFFLCQRQVSKEKLDMIIDGGAPFLRASFIFYDWW